MTLKIGDKIKSLRKKQDITQEKLADYLNISCQAVSKWENDTALPDITLLPKIANFFGVTSDELLGMRDKEESAELELYEKTYSENCALGKIFENITLSRKVLEKYPRNYQWMLNLAYPLTQYNDTVEHDEYSAEHNFIGEAVSLCERILEDCTVDSIRYGAIQILCYHYPEMGKKDQALKLAYEMPHMVMSSGFLLGHIYEGDEKIKRYQLNLIDMIDNSAIIIESLSSESMMGKELTIYQKINFIETAVSLYRSVLPEDEDCVFFNCRLCGLYGRLAELWCGVGEHGKAVDYLLMAEKAAVDYDKCVDMEEQPHKSVFLNRCTFNPKSVGRNWEGTERRSLLKRTNESVFDPLRDLDRFKDLQKRLAK